MINHAIIKTATYLQMRRPRSLNWEDCITSLNQHPHLVQCRGMQGSDGQDLHLTHYLHGQTHTHTELVTQQTASVNHLRLKLLQQGDQLQQLCDSSTCLLNEGYKWWYCLKPLIYHLKACQGMALMVLTVGPASSQNETIHFSSIKEVHPVLLYYHTNCTNLFYTLAQPQGCSQLTKWLI